MSVALPALPGYKPKVAQRAIRFKAKIDEKDFDIIKNVPKPSYKTNGTELQQDVVVLSFQGYFIEIVDDQERPRLCQLNYFVDTKEISVILKPQVNSSFPAGTYLHRGPYTNPDGQLYELHDFDFDKEIILQRLAYKLVDCDHDTREFLRKHVQGGGGSSSLSETSISTTDSPGKVTLHDEWGKFHSRKNESKVFHEASMGKSANNEAREGFMRFGSNVLKFRLRKQNPSPDDIVLEFSLIYHLADDTLEVYSLGDYNGNRDGISKLLRRSKLPKKIEMMSLNLDANNTEGFYKWTDFHIGMVLNVYNRELRIIDGDTYTRSVYEEIECPLGPAESTEMSVTKPPPREYPPPTGFGSEEDSLRSCVGSLRIGPPVIKTFGENKSYNFKAKLVDASVDDQEREFLFTFYFLDNTVKVIEPPKRNSGFVGGTFLSRRKLILADGSELSEAHLYVGAKIELPYQTFLLIDSDERVYQQMEESGHAKADIAKIIVTIRPRLMQSVKDGSAYEVFRRVQGRNIGLATRDVLVGVLCSFHLVGDDGQDGQDKKLVEHEIITIMRKFRANAEASLFFYEIFLDCIVPQPADEQTSAPNT